MKLHLTVLFSLFGFSLFAQGSCPDCTYVVPSGLAEDTIYIDPIPAATVGMYYEETISFRLPKSTTPVNATDPTIPAGLPISRITVNNFLNLPPGLSWKPNQEEYFPTDSTDGCFTICGIPSLAATYQMFLTLNADVAIISQSTSVNLQMEVLPATSTSLGGGFTLTNNIGCGEVETIFTNNVPSDGVEGFSYLWDFGNGLSSTLENPNNQVYDTPGTYLVNYQALVDTAGFTLVKVLVTDATCDDISIPFITNGEPELYIKVFDDTDTEIFESGFSMDEAPPVEFNLDLNLGEGNYTLEIWDEDAGIDGTDDLCGTINFNRFTADSITNSQVTAFLMIDHPVVEINAIDSVVVLANPTPPSISPNGDLFFCEGSPFFLTTDYEQNIQWYRDSMPIVNENNFNFLVTMSGDYYVVHTDSLGCFSGSETVSITVTAMPSAPTFVNDNNILTLFDESTLPANYVLQWYLNGQVIAGETDVMYCAQESGVYSLIVTDLTTECINSFESNIVFNSNGNCLTDTEWIETFDLHIYPNPIDNQLFIKSNTVIDLIEIYSIDGRSIERFRSDAIEQRLDLTNLASGLYVLRLVINGESLTKKLVKN